MLIIELINKVRKQIRPKIHRRELRTSNIHSMNISNNDQVVNKKNKQLLIYEFELLNFFGFAFLMFVYVFLFLVLGNMQKYIVASTGNRSKSMAITDCIDD